MTKFTRVTGKLPEEFYAVFDRDPERAAARAVEAWATARGLRFGSTGKAKALPTWYVLVESGRNEVVLLTLQPQRRGRTTEGEKQSPGAPDVPLRRWVRADPFASRAARERIVRRLHSVLPGNGKYKDHWPDKYWTFSWEDLTSEENRAAFLAILDEVVDEMQGLLAA